MKRSCSSSELLDVNGKLLLNFFSSLVGLYGDAYESLALPRKLGLQKLKTSILMTLCILSWITREVLLVIQWFVAIWEVWVSNVQRYRIRASISLRVDPVNCRLRWATVVWRRAYSVPDPNPGGGRLLPEKLGEVCGPLAKIVILFQTKICDFPYPISDLTKNLIPYFRPDL